MSMTYKWIGPRPFSKIKVYSYKKDMPPPLLGYCVTRINFGIGGCGYVYMLGEKIVSPGLDDVPVFRACLHTPGHVIGFRDADAAKNQPWHEEWRGAFHDRNLEIFDTRGKAGKI